MEPRPTILTAVTPIAYRVVESALRDRALLVPAYSLAKAEEALRSRQFDALLCAVHFDESRMFDLLRSAKEIAPDMPVVCCRILGIGSLLNRPMIEAMRISVLQSGARAYVDLLSLQQMHGEGYEAIFADAVLEHCKPKP